MSAAKSRPPPSPPDEGQFRSFVTRLLRVTKSEIDAKEATRKRRPPRKGGDKVKPD